MRLIGSLTEDDIRRRLSASNAALRAGVNASLRAALLSCGVDLTTAFVLHWIPEQAEDIYIVLDGTRQMLTIELAKGESREPTEVKAVPFADYRESVAKGSRSERLQFAVALDLLGKASGDPA